MILIDDILVSQEIVDNYFVCQLQKCKGACCYEGDYGAPLESSELEIIRQNIKKIYPYLSKASQLKIEESGFYTQNANNKEQLETALMDDASCVFMGKNELGVTFCGIEKAHLDGELDFKKPISCHLYPVRVTHNKETGFEALNYDRWDICNSACSYGEENKIKIFEFVREALIRKYGVGFYEELTAAANMLNDKS